MSTNLIIDVPEWMSDKLKQIASLCERSVDYVAASFFAAEVVHTRDAGRAVFCQQGGTHPSAPNE